MTIEGSQRDATLAGCIQPTGVLVTCDDTFSQLSVFRNDNRNDASERPLITWGVSGMPTNEVVEVPLFGQPPEGWEVKEIRDLTAAESGLAVDVEPLTGRGHDRTKIVSREAFLRKARNNCT
ncbi:hypothetical protein M8C17_17920 [Micromonospora sp. RHAY321]|uniref:hypothetical protein n=1 Tax=Micromonospora sp. RHAY321 TaxID=2944807 RepID=UPI00207C5502|nr:hypothetical protein [Micromonospora sp. RHAY321]MCO1597036.1 hypothetical protein [Micromonospora sp. RHAY321]